MRDPVVSPRSGAVFERTLVESYIATAGKDPINDEPLSVTELITLSIAPATVPPKPAAFSSIPTMLAAFQNEWDALALETYTLRRQLHDSRQELSAALYKYEAAVRVAARITKERDEAQVALRNFSEALALNQNIETEVKPLREFSESSVMDIDNNNSVKTDNNKRFEQDTKKVNGNSETEERNGEETEKDKADEKKVLRDIPVKQLLLAREELFSIHKKLRITLPITKDTKTKIEETSTEECELTGLQLVCVDTWSQRALFCGSFGTKTSDHFSSNASLGAFLKERKSSTAIALNNGQLELLEQNITHSMDLQDAKLLVTHPSEALFVAVTKSNQWMLVDTNGPIYMSEPLQHISAAAIHVDGILLALAVDGMVDIYDITTTLKVSTIDVGKGEIKDVQFALNGFWIATASENDESESSVDVFDLRKSTLVHTFSFTESVAFAIDPSSLVLITHQKNQKLLSVHLFSKKRKVWTENAAQLESDSFVHITVDSTPEEVQKKKVLRVSGYGESKIVKFSISFAQ